MRTVAAALLALFAIVALSACGQAITPAQQDQQVLQQGQQIGKAAQKEFGNVQQHQDSQLSHMVDQAQ